MQDGHGKHRQMDGEWLPRLMDSGIYTDMANVYHAYLLFWQLISTAGRSSLERLRKWLFSVVGLAKLFGFLLYVVGTTLRLVPYNINDFYPTTFRWARMLLSIDACLLFLRGLELFFVNRQLGPKLTMIYKMVGIRDYNYNKVI